MGQTVKVKAETDLESQPLLDPVQPDRTTPRTGSQNPPSRGGRKARKTKQKIIKLNTKLLQKTSHRRRPGQNCLLVLTLWRERKVKRAESETCEAGPGPGRIHAVRCDGTSTGITAAFTRLSWFPPVTAAASASRKNLLKFHFGADSPVIQGTRTYARALRAPGTIAQKSLISRTFDFDFFSSSSAVFNAPTIALFWFAPTFSRSWRICGEAPQFYLR